MTALKPLENRRVRAVASERYPLNKKCAHPECAEDAVDPHHAFPRSAIGGDSWFVAIAWSEAAVGIHDDGVEIIPHVTGLCRIHHDQVENHDAWIRLEDGVWNWYDRAPQTQEELDRWEHETGGHRDDYPVDHFELLGPLNPQPGSVEGKSKRKRFQGEERRKRRTISIRVPEDTENGGAIWDETMDNVKWRLVQEGLYDESDNIPVYEALIAALNDWLNGGAK